MNWQTILVAAIILGVAAAIIIAKLRAPKQGKSSCGGDCAACGASCNYHK